MDGRDMKSVEVWDVLFLFQDMFVFVDASLSPFLGAILLFPNAKVVRDLTNATGSTNLTEGTAGSTGSTGSTTGSGQHASQFRSQAYSSIQIGPVLCIYTDNAS